MGHEADDLVSQVNLHRSTSKNIAAHLSPTPITMHSIIALCTLALSAVALKSGSSKSIASFVTASFTNDMSGASITVKIPADDHDHLMPSLGPMNGMKGADFEFNATSAQLVHFTPVTNCMIRDSWDTIATLDAQSTFSDLGGLVVELNHVAVSCYA